MKQLLLTVLMGITFVCGAQSSFNAKDLNDRWVREDGLEIIIVGVGIYSNEGNPRAEITKLGNSRWPTKALRGIKFRDITHAGGPVWEATERGWWFANGNVGEGHFEETGQVTIRMREDKNSFSVDGSTYRRVNPITVQKFPNSTVQENQTGSTNSSFPPSEPLANSNNVSTESANTAQKIKAIEEQRVQNDQMAQEIADGVSTLTKSIINAANQGRSERIQKQYEADLKKRELEQAFENEIAPHVEKAQKGNVEAMHYLGIRYEQNGNDANAYNWYQKGVEKGYYPSMTTLYRWYTEKKAWKDKKKAEMLSTQMGKWYFDYVQSFVHSVTQDAKRADVELQKYTANQNADSVIAVARRIGSHFNTMFDRGFHTFSLPPVSGAAELKESIVWMLRQYRNYYVSFGNIPVYSDLKDVEMEKKNLELYSKRLKELNLNSSFQKFAALNGITISQ